MTRRIHRRLLAAIGATLAVVVVTAVAGGWMLGARAGRGVVIERLRSELGLAAERIASAGSPDRQRRELGELASRLGVRLTLIDADRRMVADSHGGREGARLPAREAPELEQASRAGWGSARHRAAGSGLVYQFVAVRIDGNRGTLFLRAALPRAGRVLPGGGPAAPLLLLVVAGPAAGLLVLAILLRRMLAPVAAGERAARALAEGRFDEPLPGAGDAGPETVAALLETARARMAQRIRRFEQRYHDLARVVSGMKEALVLVESDRRIALVNDAFRRVADPRVDPVGRPLAEVLRDPEANAVIEDVLERGHDRRALLRRSGPDRRAWELIVYPLSRGAEPGRAAGAVALFLDVSRLERLEQTRRDFIANVSHELRTPLTSIKAAAMTLADGGADDPEARGRFLATIVRQVDRMVDLVSDLGDLSRIETGAVRLEPQEVELGPLVDDVVHQVRLRHADAEVAIRAEFPAGLRVVADRGRLEQILVNLVDNAVKFNRPGGRVTIRGWTREDGRPTLAVEDTGIGIALEDQEKVFSRFYRVDASRSREQGGTGLGLAIVKHLMALHGGRVRLESELGCGSRFLLEF